MPCARMWVAALKAWAILPRPKAEIYQGLNADGLALIPCEDANAAVFQRPHKLSSNTRSAWGRAISMRKISCCSRSLCAFDLVRGGERAAVLLPVPGKHNIHNAVAAAALALAAGLRPAELQTAWKSCQHQRPSANQKRHENAVVLDDAYNANPRQHESPRSMCWPPCPPRACL